MMNWELRMRNWGRRIYHELFGAYIRHSTFVILHSPFFIQKLLQLLVVISNRLAQRGYV